MHIGLNAHLLSGQVGYRSAGIHGYIYNLLSHLPAAAPADWCFSAMVGGGNPLRFPAVDMQRAQWDTEHPLRRILWEQLVQPWQLGAYDLYHALTFVSPVILTRPSVVTVYDLSFVHYPQVLSTARRLYLRWFTTLSLRRARRVIAISHSTARDIALTLGIDAARIDVAQPGFNRELFKALPKEQVAAFRQQQALPPRFWLFVGTLEPRKNLPTLLRAYARLSPDSRLPLVLAGGKGWQYDEIFAVIEAEGLRNSVYFPGYIAAEQLPLWYNSAEVFLYPSLFEGFGLPVLEAMACGTPVIVSNASSLPEVVGAAGVQRDAHDIAAWTDALYRAYHDAVWRADARSSGIMQAEKFSWEGTAQATVMSYQQAAKG